MLSSIMGEGLMEQLVLKKAYQEYLKLSGKHKLKLSSSSQQKLWKFILFLSERLCHKVTKSARMGTIIYPLKKPGEKITIGKYPKHSLRHTNPYLKNLSDTEVQNLITRSAESSIRVENPTFRFSATHGLKKKSKRTR